ncbi:hypothetical protein RD792_003220 [Penstemon davidsonii]|uniref:Receptor-like serine/threonine-protein kinase n=1 Tax=Penstemon davidsonii TaxID=160366 RepID=A0ABR0DU33_9LAMI|nr:hypothetical protein RD792_003220 [Penstemon davidsonii]
MAFAILCRIIFAILILLPISTIAQTNLNITLGSSIVANRSNSTWLSPSGEFAFGFQQIVPGSYLLAIWFNNIPQRTIVWSANRNNLAEEGSIIQLFQDGRFELNDPRGQRIWAANLAGPRVAYAAMLDIGNFVLASNTSRVVWQSFDEPTDTLLPGQTLNQGGDLVASFSETNYSSGRFLFAMQTDGNLVFYTRNFPMNDNIFAYTSTQTVDSGYQVVFNQSGYIFLAARNGTILSFLSSESASSSQFYQRAILEYDGVLRHYVYPRSNNGPGACGFNSFCSLGTDQRPNCECPNGYSPVDRNDRMSGCKLDYVPQSCDREINETGLFSFIEMPNADWPDFDYDIFEQYDEDSCRRACLDDCFCAVAIYNDRGCWKKKFPLSNGRLDSSIGGKALIKIRTRNATVNPTSESQQNRKDQSTLIITGSALLGSSVFLNLVLLSSLLIFICYNRRKSSIIQSYTVLPGVNIRSFTFIELQEATNGFKEELGNGACSTVYKGVINNENGKLIAVKKLGKMVEEAEVEFKAEVSSISRTNHKNLVQLLGYCDEGQNKLLVYEFMSNGSLSSFIFGNSRPSWYKRVQIACAIARGLCYLHDECSTQIIHCDIKPQNVLLDETLTAKISDFGLAKLLRPDQTRTTTGIRGTRGYVAPEWFRNMPITVKVDVYSFGILLLELICCRRNVQTDVENENEEILSYWAYDCYKIRTLKLLVADDEEAIYDIKQFEKFLMIALWCIQEDPSLRPKMKRVLHMLEGSVEVPIPPNPESFTTIC